MSIFAIIAANEIIYEKYFMKNHVAGYVKPYGALHQPGNPQQNACVERFNRTVRYDLLNQYIFKEITDVQIATTKWLWTYNNERPNMALGGITPNQKLTIEHAQ